MVVRAQLPNLDEARQHIKSGNTLNPLHIYKEMATEHLNKADYVPQIQNNIISKSTSPLQSI